MRLLLLLASLLSASAAENVLPPPGSPAAEVAINFVPGRFIVQFSQTGSSKYRKRDGSTDTTGFFKTLEAAGQKATPVMTYGNSLFHGVSFQVSSNKTSTATIQALPEVEKIWPVEIYNLPSVSEVKVQAREVLATSAAWNPHNTTNVNKVHALGHLGRGVVVATVDSGVNYSIPALGGGFGPGFKVEAGYDLVGNDYIAGGLPIPDSDPMDCLGHGTHVAGIIASGDPDLPGVAPKATLRSYKVFGCGDGAASDVVIAAILRAYEDGADIINLSLGSSQGFPDNPTALVNSKVQAAGIFVAVANGNSGERGPFFTSNAGNGFDVTAVGSIEQPATSNITGYLNSFTSWGPTLDGRMKPDISAPGGHINSTYKNGQWAVLSGTSMASPYIAGVAALFFESRGGRAAIGAGGSLLAHNVIQASGNPVLMEGSTQLAHVARQGSGMVDALKVVSYTTTVSPSALYLNETAYFKPQHTVTITNSGDEEVTYTLTHVPGSLFGAKENTLKGDTWVSLTPIIYSGADYTPAVVISQNSISVAAGATATFSVTFTEPAKPDPILLNVYGGAIIINGTNSESIRLSYMGIKGDLYSQDVWEMNRGTPLFLDGFGNGQVTDGLNYTMAIGQDYTVSVPTPYCNFLWATEEISFDFVYRDWTPSDWVYPPTTGQNNWLGGIRVRPNALTGSVINYPIIQLPRASGVLYSYPQPFLANGTVIPEGQFRILGRALRTYGNPQNLTDWQYKLSNWFNIIHAPAWNTTTSAAPTSTSTSTSTTIPTCGVTAPLVISAQSTNQTSSHPVYRYSDFLAQDLVGDKAATLGNFYLTSEGYLQSQLNGYYLSTHSNADSLIYIYPSSHISGAFSYIKCTKSSSNALTCEGAGKNTIYVCAGDTGLFRFSAAVGAGCYAVTLSVSEKPDPTCAYSTGTAIQTVSASATITGTAIITSALAPTPTETLSAFR
ncbi:peptidase S8/S53 domain-containing protein [Halenospora varia]|nr:peptidase S8/S53 domain-containing protein [Halenospora varia]